MPHPHRHTDQAPPSPPSLGAPCRSCPHPGQPFLQPLLGPLGPSWLGRRGWANEEVAWPEARILGGLVIRQLGERAGGPLGARVSRGRTCVPGQDQAGPLGVREAWPRHLLTTRSAALGPGQVKSQAMSLHPGEGPRSGPVLSMDSRPHALATGRCLTCPLSPATRQEPPVTRASFSARVRK